ncbi:hypothetical protein [Kribbella sancticallisti]|uniref:hypothetical protein n=1 Tax=Kribbella sancticallisti TaxID=460087 RepID=UPI0031DEA360
MTFQAAAYSAAELGAAVHETMVNNNPAVSSAAPLPDYSGIQITLSSKAPPNTLVQAKASSTIPIVLRGVNDPKPLDRRTPLATSTHWRMAAPRPMHGVEIQPRSSAAV